MHRTAARATLLLFLLAAATAGATTAGAGKGAVPQLVFPVVGQVTWTDDWGSPRGSRRHEGNDLMAPKRSPAVAAEAGTVKFWTTSANAGCMLFLEGDSGTTYLYVHLNNDVTLDNDNRGKCVAGVAYAPKLASGDHVEAGQPIGFVGDSGDADGIASHLHFEVHPGGGAAVNPYPFLRKAKKLLVAAPPAGAPFTLKLSGTLVEAQTDALRLKVESLYTWPARLRTTKVARTLTIALPFEAEVLPTPIETALPGQRLTVWTLPATPTLAALTGAPNVLAASKIHLG